MATSFQVTFDCADPDALSKFWAALLGYTFEPPPEGSESWEDWARGMGIPEESWNDAAATIDPEGAGPPIRAERMIMLLPVTGILRTLATKLGKIWSWKRNCSTLDV